MWLEHMAKSWLQGLEMAGGDRRMEVAGRGKLEQRGSSSRLCPSHALQAPGELRSPSVYESAPVFPA